MSQLISVIVLAWAFMANNVETELGKYQYTHL